MLECKFNRNQTKLIMIQFDLVWLIKINIKKLGLLCFDLNWMNNPTHIWYNILLICNLYNYSEYSLDLNWIKLTWLDQIKFIILIL